MLPSGITVGAAVEQSESANNIATWIAWILSKAKKKKQLSESQFNLDPIALTKAELG